MNHHQKLEALRGELKKEALSGFIIPRADEYQGEFVAPYAERLSWLTGFTGSAGDACVLESCAVVMSDARYTLQLEQQVEHTLYDRENSIKLPLMCWMAEHVEENAVIGYDPMLHTVKEVEDFKRALAPKFVEFRPVCKNLIDRIWSDQPSRPQGMVEIFPDKIAGRCAKEKIKLICHALVEKEAQAFILSAPDSIAWLLNIRGSDVNCTPLLLSYAILHVEEELVEWFVDHSRVPENLYDHLGECVKIVDPADMDECLAHIKTDTALDFARSPVWFKDMLEKAGVHIINMKDPCLEPRALKTPAEQAAIRDAHMRDGAALVKFMAWLDETGAKGGVTELDIADKVLKFRREDENCTSESFPSIAGFGANGAVIHYRATPEHYSLINAPGVLLLDSGGQYKSGGTTDLTRTIFVGGSDDKPLPEIRENYTRVLKGHIALARAHFPEGTTGAQLDTLARIPLWEAGLDYAHGTGHGVGCYLGVHEDAAGISPRGRAPLKAGMLISNEPGYYRQGAYGIRIESLVLVKEVGREADTDRAMLGFDTISLVPFERRLIDVKMLSIKEVEWIDAYHSRIVEELKPFLKDATQMWLRRVCEPLFL